MAKGDNGVYRLHFIKMKGKRKKIDIYLEYIRFPTVETETNCILKGPYLVNK